MAKKKKPVDLLDVQPVIVEAWQKIADAKTVVGIRHWMGALFSKLTEYREDMNERQRQCLDTLYKVIAEFDEAAASAASDEAEDGRWLADLMRPVMMFGAVCSTMDQAVYGPIIAELWKIDDGRYAWRAGRKQLHDAIRACHAAHPEWSYSKIAKHCLNTPELKAQFPQPPSKDTVSRALNNSDG